MKAHEKVQNDPLKPGEIFEFFGTVAEQLPRDLEPAKVRYYNERKSRLGKEFRTLFGKPLPEFNIDEWKSFFEKVFGRKPNLSDIYVPQKPAYECWPIVNPLCFTNNDAFDAATRRFKTWRYANDLNTVRDVVKRPDRPHVVWIKTLIEADPDMANKSAEDIKREKINTATLFERQTLELKYNHDTGGHLDIENWTLCAGSRYRDGSVPNAYWRPGSGGFSVGWYFPDDAYSSLRARVAVS